MADQEESFTFGKADYDECVKFREFQQRLKDVTDAQQQEKQQHKKTRKSSTTTTTKSTTTTTTTSGGLHRSIDRGFGGPCQQAHNRQERVIARSVRGRAARHTCTCSGILFQYRFPL